MRDATGPSLSVASLKNEEMSPSEVTGIHKTLMLILHSRIA
jgi:hypothetical protein